MVPAVNARVRDLPLPGGGIVIGSFPFCSRERQRVVVDTVRSLALAAT